MTTNAIDQRILLVAAELLGEAGDNFTVDQLVAKTGIPRATIYRRIGSKEALLQRLADEQGVVRDPQRDVRTRIVRAARQVFGCNGLAGATIEQVAGEAGLGIATVYRHFGDKDHLVWAVVEEFSLRPFVRDLVQPTDDVAADLLTLTNALLPSFYENRDMLRLILTANAQERAYIERLQAGGASSDRTLDQLATYFAAQLDAGRLRVVGKPQELALAFLGLLFTFAMIGPTHYGTTIEEPERVSRLIVQIFLDGLGRSP